jgi:uncharacterized protein (TIGR03084 family)
VTVRAVSLAPEPEVRVADPTGVLADLRAEGDTLDAVVAGLDRAGWRSATPAAGWTVAHQVAHLAWTDTQALRAATDAAGFADWVADSAAGLPALVDDAAAEGAAAEPAELLARWRDGRTALAGALGALPPEIRLPWFGPPMSVASMATARLMETWAHGLDVTDALGQPPSVSPRLRHVAHLGVRTRDFAFGQHGLSAPAEPFRVELTGTDGELWAWGPADAAQRVTGPALDFCLLVTQRRHRADLALTAVGTDADRWLDLAQAFAGDPGTGRPPAGS